ncbi:hypothetical protein TRFO_21188 [Tritrichomonas foetus]|uniref:Uncharacterized protein n=1 Tax=Tritrichomonas foetus TaxID=1144522 RepID=A0A1J4KK89_9EUKA|nr:hypothetical protein TRFO_21188 [Tritrichomonas foetus]|eukprot:OHT09765.1 hypothetical protein TRFO_21188 [Tritrichomonas foetus]
MNNPFQALDPTSPENNEGEKDNGDQKTQQPSQIANTFLQQIQNSPISSLSELAEKIEVSLAIEPDNKLNFLKNFDKYSVTVLEYEEDMKKRLSCFEDKEDLLFLKRINDIIAAFDTFDLRPLLDQIIESLNQPEPTGHGGLFLLGIIVARRPDLITPKLLSFSHTNMTKVAPIICWIIGHATSSLTIQHLDPLLSHQLLEIFLPELLNREKSSNAVSVCAAHLIATAFAQQNVMRASAAHYVRILNLTKITKSTRDKRVSSIFKRLIDKLTVVDMKDLAHQMFDIFPDAPKFACELFIQEATKKNGGNASFVDGWIEAHSNHKKASMKYLTEVLGSLPEYVVNKFPMEDLIKGGDLAKLAAMKVQLTNSSFKFIFILVIVAILYTTWNKRMSPT